MKQRFLFVISLTSLLIISVSCIFVGPWLKGNGDVREQNRKVSDFEEIEVRRGMNVYITQGDQVKVVVRADENLLEAIETKVEGDRLIVTTNQNIRSATEKKVLVTVPKITVIHSASGANVFSQSVLNTKEIDLSASSGSNQKLELDANDIKVSVSSGSNIRLEGSARDFSGKVSSGANIKAEELTVENCNARASSGGNIRITATNNFRAHASSGGNIHYSGNPKTTDIEKSSGGNVIRQ